MKDALEAQRERRPAMRNSSTVAMEGILIFKENQLTIGLDLGDRTSHYCILNEAGEAIWESKLPTTLKGIEEVFGRAPRSRIALETGTHSPWIRRQLSEWGHEVIVAHARNVRLIGESSRKDDRLDARTLARNEFRMADHSEVGQTSQSKRESIKT
jgi:transposase